MEFKEARVLFYCLGSGMGHLTRAAAISRKMKRFISGEIAIITNSPFHYLLEVEDISTIYLKNLTEIDDQTGALIRGIIGQVNPELLVVDSYPAGIREELVPLLSSAKLKKAFLRRRIDEEFLSHQEMASCALKYFDIVIDCEPLPPLEHPLEIECCPIMVRDADELLASQVARDVLLSRNSYKVILGVTTRKKEDSLEFFNLLEKVSLQIRRENYELRFASPYNFADVRETWHNIRYFPLFEISPGVDILVGYYGYNLFYESRMRGVPTIFISREPLHPAITLGPHQVLASDNADDLERTLRETMDKSESIPAPEPVEFENRAQKAAAYLTHLLFSTDKVEVKEYQERIKWFLM
jgi:hypothetical protein